MHVDEMLCHGKNGGTTWDTSHRGCIMRKVISKEVTAGQGWRQGYSPPVGTC